MSCCSLFVFLIFFSFDHFIVWFTVFNRRCVENKLVHCMSIVENILLIKMKFVYQFKVTTLSSFLLCWLMTWLLTRVVRLLPLVYQKLFTFVLLSHSLYFYLCFAWSLFCLYFFNLQFLLSSNLHITYLWYPQITQVTDFTSL